MKKSLSFVALFALVASLAACGKGGSGHALETIENVGNSMSSASSGLKSGRTNLSLTSDRLNVNSAPQSSSTDFTDSKGDFSFHVNNSSSSQSNPGFSVSIAPKSQKMKDALDIQSLDISYNGSSSVSGESRSGKETSVIGGKSKESGEFKISQTLETTSSESALAFKYTLTIEAGGEKDEVLVQFDASQSGEGSAKATLNGDEMSEEDGKKIVSALKKIGDSLAVFEREVMGSVSPTPTPASSPAPSAPSNPGEDF